MLRYFIITLVQLVSLSVQVLLLTIWHWLMLSVVFCTTYRPCHAIVEVFQTNSKCMHTPNFKYHSFLLHTILFSASFVTCCENLVCLHMPEHTHKYIYYIYCVPPLWLPTPSIGMNLAWQEQNNLEIFFHWNMSKYTWVYLYE